MQLANGSNRFIAALRVGRVGLFGATLVMSKKITAHTWQVLLALLITACQLLAFVITTEPLTNNLHSTISPAQLIASITQPTRFLTWFPSSSHITLYYICIAYVFVWCILTAHTMYQFLTNRFTSASTVRIARIMGQLSSGILFIPLMSVLASTFDCGGNTTAWTDAGYVCSSLGFLVLECVSMLLCAVLFLLASVFTLLYYDCNPLSKQTIAKAHGRVDFLLLVIQTLLVFICNIFNTYLNAWIIVAVLVGSAALWLAGLLLMMPFYRHAMNTAYIVIACLFCYASICMTFNEGYEATDAAVMIYLGAPAAALAGIALSNMRATQVIKTPAIRINNVFDIELKCRYLLHQALWGHPTDNVTFGFNAEAAINSAAARDHSKLHAGAHLHSSSIKLDGESESAVISNIVEDVDAVDEQDDRAAATRRLIPQEHIQQVHEIFSQAMSRFRQSPMLHIFFARFYAVFQGNKHMQMSHLLQAERRKPPLDISYLVFQARKLAENDSGSSGQLSAMNRVTFEKYAADARKYVLRASTRQVAFWMELCDSVPDLSRLHRLSNEMNIAITQAEHAFTELFTLNPQSLVIMRLYAAFNLHVTCDVEKATVLLADADRIEDQKSKDFRNEVAGGVLPIMEESNLDVFADSTAVITVGGTPRNLGMIASVNSSGCKLFGYSRAQFERRNVFALLPTPLDEIHEASLQQYGKLRLSQAVVR
jgi:PAS domain-containing protein